MELLPEPILLDAEAIRRALGMGQVPGETIQPSPERIGTNANLLLLSPVTAERRTHAVSKKGGMIKRVWHAFLFYRL